jgi:hypothetical protein
MIPYRAASTCAHCFSRPEACWLALDNAQRSGYGFRSCLPGRGLGLSQPQDRTSARCGAPRLTANLDRAGPHLGCASRLGRLRYEQRNRPRGGDRGRHHPTPAAQARIRGRRGSPDRTAAPQDPASGKGNAGRQRQSCRPARIRRRRAPATRSMTQSESGRIRAECARREVTIW